MKSSSLRGQISLEYVILTGILLIILIPVVYTSLSTAHQYYKVTRLDDLASQIANKADDVYQLGPGNKDELHLVIPSGITGATVAGNEIAFHTTTGEQNASVRKYTGPDLVGSVDFLQGEYFVPIKALNASLVRIGSGPWIVEIIPSCIGAPSFADPPNITLRGDDFSATSVLLKNGVAFNSAYYQIIDPSTLVFIAHPTEFSAQPSGTPYTFSITDATKNSNTIDFWVYPSVNLCP